MLTFLNPGLLIGLIAAAIPILIHLFTRRKVKTIPFSTLRFIKELQRRKIRYLKLRQILLLILRTLAILFLILAFARPALKQTRGALSAEAPSTVAIILDNTLSMGLQTEGRSRLELARERAQRVLELLRDGDEIYLIYPQRPVRLATAEPLRQLQIAEERIENTELSDAATDLWSALALAVDKLASSQHLNKEIYLLSDLQRSGFQASGHSGEDTLRIPDEITLFVLPVLAGGRANLTLDSVAVVNQIIERGRVVEVAATVRNTGSIPLRDRLVHLYVDGKRVGQATVSLEPGTASRVLFRIVPDRTGTTAGYARLEDDSLPQDNRRYFVFHIPEEIRVLLVGGKPEDTRYLRLALRPDDRSTTYIRVQSIRPDGLNRRALSRADVVILANVPTVDDGAALTLREFVRQGGGLVVFLGSDVDVRNYNENLFPRLKMPTLTRSIGRIGATDAFLTFGKIDYGHPIFHGVFEDRERRIESPRVRFAFDISRNAPHVTIIAYGNGAPFLLEGGVGKGRVFLVTTALDESWSDLAVRGIFAPLVNRTVTYLAGRVHTTAQFLSVGSELVLQPKVEGANLQFAIEKPDGDLVRLKPEVAAGAYALRFRAKDRAGVYRVLVGERQLAAFAVNPLPEESDLASVEPQEVQSIAGAQRFATILDEASLPEIVRRSRYGRELWELFLFAALACLLFEMLLFRGRLEEEEEKPGRVRHRPAESVTVP